MTAISDAIERILATYQPLDENGLGTLAEGIEDCLPDEGFKIVPLADLDVERAVDRAARALRAGLRPEQVASGLAVAAGLALGREPRRPYLPDAEELAWLRERDARREVTEAEWSGVLAYWEVRRRQEMHPRNHRSSRWWFR